MAVDTVPWFVQAPAEHSAEVARTLAYQAIGGKEGLARSGDLLVRALPVPGGAVQVLPGAAGILNRASGGSGQAYVGRVGAAVSVPIAATGSGTGRTDLIVFRVDDPQYGGNVPPSAEQGPYIRLDVISGVNASVTRVQDVPGHEADSAVTLARVTLPASTGTVTNAMVTNVSRVANPLQEMVQIGYSLVGAEVNAVTATSAYPAGGQTWPLQAEDAGQLEVDIPEWASEVVVEATWYGVVFPGGAAEGSVWVQIAPTVNPANVKTQNSAWSAGSNRVSIGFADTVQIPEALRGTRQKVYPRATRVSGTNATTAQLDRISSLSIKLTFREG